MSESIIWICFSFIVPLIFFIKELMMPAQLEVLLDKMKVLEDELIEEL